MRLQAETGEWNISGSLSNGGMNNLTNNFFYLGEGGGEGVKMKNLTLEESE